MPTQQQTVVLEAAAQEFADATSQPPLIYQLSPDKAREVLEGVQQSPIDKPAADIEDIIIPGGPHGQIAVRLIRPAAHRPAARHPLRARCRVGARQPADSRPAGAQPGHWR